MKTWWGIRHVRWFIWKRRVERWVDAWVGIGVGICMNKNDEDHLNAIWRGER